MPHHLSPLKNNSKNPYISMTHYKSLISIFSTSKYAISSHAMTYFPIEKYFWKFKEHDTSHYATSSLHWKIIQKITLYRITFFHWKIILKILYSYICMTQYKSLISILSKCKHATLSHVMSSFSIKNIFLKFK
jgi:hypothetical protein